MTTPGDYARGTQPQKEPTKKPQPAQEPGQRKGRSDGITSLSGTVTFGSASVSLNVSVTPYNGAASNLQAAGAVGNSATNATAVSASRSTDDATRRSTVTASGLPAATAGSNYTVQLRYDSPGACTKTGTVLGANVVIGQNADITLS